MHMRLTLLCISMILIPQLLFGNPEKEATEILEKMTLDQKIGQVFMIGIGTQYDTSQALLAIQNQNIGGILLYSNNLPKLSKLRTMIKKLQATSHRQSHDLPLLVAIDQEGGPVTRLKQLGPYPSNLTLGAANSDQLTYAMGVIAGKDLRQIGINMNLAPVLDINTTNKATIIGERSYSNNPNTVAKLGSAYIAGLQSQGLIATAKHFPGHGATTDDSHKTLPVINHSKIKLDHQELIPFRAAIKSGVKSIMTAHVIQNQLDPSTPASISNSVTTSLLRQGMGFNGLIITDDIAMNALSENWDVTQLAVLGLLAGSDIILTLHFPHNITAMQQAVKTALQTGILPKNRLDDAVKRIIMAKLFQKTDSKSTPLKPTISRQEVVSGIYKSAVCRFNQGHLKLPLTQNIKISIGGTKPFIRRAKPKLSKIGTPTGNPVLITEIKSKKGVATVNKYVRTRHKNVIAIITGNPFLSYKLDPSITTIVTFGSHPAAIKQSIEIVTGESSLLGQWPLSAP